MRVSMRVDYAIRSMSVLASCEGGPLVKADAIARGQDIPLKFLLDILGELRRAQLVRSMRGPDGGYALARAATAITLADIFRAIDGPLADVHDESLRNLRYAPPSQSLPRVWMAVRASLRRVLETVTLADLAEGHLPDAVVSLADEYEVATALADLRRATRP